MGFHTWRRIAWAYHLTFAAAVVWPVQSLLNTPDPFVLGLPFLMAWPAGWVLGSLLVLWRLDAARTRHLRAASPGGDE